MAGKGTSARRSWSSTSTPPSCSDTTGGVRERLRSLAFHDSAGRDEASLRLYQALADRAVSGVLDSELTTSLNADHDTREKADE